MIYLHNRTLSHHPIQNKRPSLANRKMGFTLIELMIVVSIIAILSMIALPSYNNYIKRAHIKAAQSDLVTLGLVLEGSYQRKLEYPVITATNTTTIIEKEELKAWKPTENVFNYAVTSSQEGYTITATKDTCTMTMTNTTQATPCDSY